MKGASCHFCSRSFRNKQAVRAHLKGCPAYRQMPKAMVPSTGSKPKTSGSRERDDGTRPGPAPVSAVNRPPRQTPQLASGPSHKPYEKELRRWAIQSVKDEVINSWWSLDHTIPSETKAKALVAIEQELSRLPADQLPRSELVAIAQGIRDRIYQPVIQAEQRARQEEERKRNQARLRTTLISSGVAHATRTLREQQDLDGWTRLDLEQKVKRALENDIDGSESEADVHALVGDLLAQQLEPLKTRRREKTRQRLIEHGVAYVRRQLASEEDLDAREHLCIERDVKQDLDKGVTGEESEGDVEAFVDEVLDELLGETEEEDEGEEGDEEDEDDAGDGEGEEDEAYEED